MSPNLDMYDQNQAQVGKKRPAESPVIPDQVKKQNFGGVSHCGGMFGNTK